jgi:hypothetical protein
MYIAAAFSQHGAAALAAELGLEEAVCGSAAVVSEPPRTKFAGSRLAEARSS